jgi:hypothetical protein
MPAGRRLETRFFTVLLLPASELFFIIILHGPRRKHSLSIVGKACLHRRCITTEVTQLLLAYSLPRVCVYRVVAWQWTSILTSLFRLSGVMSQYVADMTYKDLPLKMIHSHTIFHVSQKYFYNCWQDVFLRHCAFILLLFIRRRFFKGTYNEGRPVGWTWINLKVWGNGGRSLFWGTSPASSCTDWGKPRILKARLADFKAEIKTRKVPNMKQTCQV